MSEWQPISTAPKDGRLVLLFAGNAMMCAAYDFGDDEWIYAYTDVHREGAPGLFYCSYAINPSHWMPLPDPPTITKPEG